MILHRKLSVFIPVLLLVMALFSAVPAEAQYTLGNPFKDPVVSNNAANSAVDFKAVTENILGGKVAVGGTAYVVVLFKNMGSSTIKTGSINLYPSSTVSAQVTLNQCADAPIASDAQCAITVAVKGLTSGAWRVEMLVDHDGRSRIAIASLSGDVEAASKTETAGKQDIEISPGNLYFGTSAGGIELVRSLVLNNHAAETIKIKNIILSAPEQSGFSYKSQCPESLRPEESCTLIVSWLPTSRGLAQGVIAIQHSGKTGMTQAEIKGLFQPPTSGDAGNANGKVEISPTSLDFGTSPGGLALKRAVVLSNRTGEDINIWSMDLKMPELSGFSYESQCPEILLPDETCNVIITWTPTTKGLAQGLLAVQHSGRTGMAQVEIKGSLQPVGEAVRDNTGKVELSPENMDFGISSGGIPIKRSIVLSNHTAEDVDIWDIDLDVPEQSGFSYFSQCPQTLMPEEACNITVSWLPTSKGLAQGVLTIQHSGRAGMVRAEMKGVFQSTGDVSKDTEGKVEVSPDIMDFGLSSGGIALVRSMVISNHTSEPVKLTNVILNAPDQSGFSYKSECPETLAVDGVCNIIVTWLPTSRGLAQGVLAVQHSGKGGLVQTELKGTLQSTGDTSKDAGGKVEAGPEIMDFGVSSGGIAMIRSIVLSNHTHETIKITNIALNAPDQSGFSYKSECPEMLPEEGMCNIIVTWLPTSKGLAQGVLTAYHSGKGGLVQTELKGTLQSTGDTAKDAGGKVEVEPELMDFGVSPGGIALVRSLVLTNRTPEEIKIKDVSLNASEQSGFSFKSQCGETLAPEKSCNVVVTWLPTSKGLAQGSLVVQHSGKAGVIQSDIKGTLQPNAVTSATIYPEATPDKGLLVSDKEAIDFGSGIKNESAITVTLVNSGKVDLTIEDIRLAIGDRDLSISGSGCRKGTVLSPSGACPLIMAWSPTHEGSIIDSLQIVHTGARGLLVMPVRGTADPSVGTAIAGKTVVSSGSDKTGSVFSVPPTGYGGRSGAPALKSVFGNYTVTSHSSSRAVINGPSGGLVVRDGETVVLSGIKCTVTIVPNGVILSSGKDSVTLLFDKSLRLLDQATSSISSESAPAAAQSPVGSLYPPALPVTTQP